MTMRVFSGLLATETHTFAPMAAGGQYTAAAAARKELEGADKLWSGIPNVWVLDK